MQFTQTIDIKNQEINAMPERWQKQLDEVNRQHEIEKMRLTATLVQANSRVDELSLANKDLLQRLEEETRQHSAQLVVCEEDYLRRLRLSEQKGVEADAQCRDMQRKLLEMEAGYHEELDSLKQELDTMRSSLRASGDERDKAHERSESYEVQLHSMRRELEARVKEATELSDEYQALDARFRQIRELHHQITIENESLKTKMKYYERDVEVLQKEMDDLQNQYNHSMHLKTDEMINEISRWKQRAETAEKSSETVQQESRLLIQKLREDKNRYKKMSVKLSNRVAALQRDVTVAKKEAELAKQASVYEVQSLNKQLREAERQREEMRLRLALNADSVITAASLHSPLGTLQNFPTDHSNHMGGSDGMGGYGGSYLPAGRTNQSLSSMLQDEQKHQAELMALMQRVSTNSNDEKLGS
eukprot:TRINITY_DN12929_c0_g1_i1.p1 TRINITY_DN12929_c0_g1~~TRINITY_DN12929_c0_g1_i1.p1  ORF type:complete len:417 (-),score=68.96 TRINITY_DN12929_c0_g1_i1:35-1285(-)